MNFENHNSSGVVSSHYNDTISATMKDTIFPHHEQYSTTPLNPLDHNPPTHNILSQQPTSFTLKETTPTLSTLSPLQKPHSTKPTPASLPQLSSDDPLLDDLGITTDSNITPAVYNLWRSFASIFLPQSLALPPSLNPVSLLPYAHIVDQLQPFDLILIQTPGMFYTTMRRVVEHQYDHVAIVLTQSCALHISPPFTRIIPVATLLSPIRNPIILRPKLNHSINNNTPNPTHLNPPNPKNTPQSNTNTPITLSSAHLMNIYNRIRAKNTTTIVPTMSTSVTTNSDQSHIIHQMHSHPLHNTDVNDTINFIDMQQYSMFLELMSLLGTPYDSIKMYTLWGKLAVNRVTNQPLARIDSTGIICTDAIISILCKYEIFTLQRITKNWSVLNAHTKFKFNPRSNNAITLSKQLTQSSDLDKTLNQINGENILVDPDHINNEIEHNDENDTTINALSNHDQKQTRSNSPNHPFIFQSIPQATIYHQLPLSNFEALDFHRLSAWSLNDLLQLSHEHYISPDPKSIHALKNTTQTQTFTPSNYTLKNSFSNQQHQNLFSRLSDDRMPTQPFVTYPQRGSDAIKKSNVSGTYNLQVNNNHASSGFASQKSSCDVSPLDLPPSTQHSKQFNELVNQPLLIDAAFEVIKPQNPIPIELIFSFCNQLTLLCANFVMRETSSNTVGPSSQTKILHGNLDTKSQPSITTTYRPKHNQRELLRLVNPYYRLSPQKSPQNPTSTNDPIQNDVHMNKDDVAAGGGGGDDDDITAILADSLYYHLLCKLPGTIPFLILHALNNGLVSLQKGKKYELKPEVLLFSLETTHPALIFLENEVRLMYQELILAPFFQQQASRQDAMNAKIEPKPIKSHTSPSPLSSSDNTMNKTTSLTSTTAPTIGQQLKSTFNLIVNYTSMKLFNKKYITDGNPDGLDPTIQAQLDQIDLKNDPTQHIIVGKDINNNKPPPSQTQSQYQQKQHPEAITQFPSWLNTILPHDLISKIKELTNIVISPRDGYNEYLRQQSGAGTNISNHDTNNVRGGVHDLNHQHPFPSIKYLSSVPAPFLLYIWSLLKPIVRFYLILTLLSRFLPYLVYKLTATALITIISLPTNTISWLSSKAIGVTTPIHDSSIPTLLAAHPAAPALSAKHKRSFLGLLRRRGVASQQKRTIFQKVLGLHKNVAPTRSIMRPALIGYFQSRFVTFVSAIVAASLLRYAWRNAFGTGTSQQNHPKLQLNPNQPQPTRLNSMMMRNTNNTDKGIVTNNDSSHFLVTVASLPIQPHKLTDDMVLSLTPSNIVNQQKQHQIHTQNNSNSTTTNGKTHSNQEFNTHHDTPPRSTVYSTSFISNSLLQAYYRWIFPHSAQKQPNQKSTPIDNIPPPPSSPPSPPPRSILNFLTQTDQSLQWLNEVFYATIFVTTDTLGLRSLNKRLAQSRSMKEIKKQVGYVREQFNNNTNNKD